MTSGAGGWRVAIVDTADDMNDNAANALLKMLEEPPAPRHADAAVQHAGTACCPPSARAASGWICGRWTRRSLAEALKRTICRTRTRRNAPRWRGFPAARSARRCSWRAARAASWPPKPTADRKCARRPTLLALLALGDRLCAHAGRAGALRRFSGRSLAARIRAQARHSGAPIWIAGRRCWRGWKTDFARAARPQSGTAPDNPAAPRATWRDRATRGTM